MMLRIDGNTRLRDIQAAFAERFRFLKLEFFRHPHKPRQPSHSRDLRSVNEPACPATTAGGTIEIPLNETYRVSDLEHMFEKEAGLFVQVFRQSGTVWIETTLTDDWTLEQQNREGELFSQPLPIRSINNGN